MNKLHHKLAVIDDQLIIVGSFNYTGPANAVNDENTLVIGDLDETNAQAIANQQRLGSLARQEIDRIVQAFGEPL